MNTYIFADFIKVFCEYFLAYIRLEGILENKNVVKSVYTGNSKVFLNLSFNFLLIDWLRIMDIFFYLLSLICETKTDFSPFFIP